MVGPIRDVTKCCPRARRRLGHALFALPLVSWVLWAPPRLSSLSALVLVLYACGLVTGLGNRLRGATRARAQRLRGLLRWRGGAVTRARQAELPPVCESVLQWALSHPDADVQRLHAATTIRRHSPRALDHPAAQQFFSSFPPEYVLPEQYLARLPGAFLVGDVGLVVLPDGSFSAESIYDRSNLLDASAYRTPLPANPRFERGDFYTLLIKFAQGQNYYHWLHDVVLRLYDIVDRLPPTARFVVPPHRLPFQDEYLSIAGINAERLWEFDGGVVQLENLYFSPPSALTGTDSPAAEIWFRDRVLSTYGIALGPAYRRVYITRRNARYRRIVNECEVETLLQEFGFETHELESYSVRDQVALFAEAEMVVSAHGAGLTNILFSPPSLRVIDIFEGSLFAKCFWGMSTALGHHYWPLVGDTVPNGHSASDIRVSIPMLRQIVSVD